MPIKVMPTCTAERNWVGSSESLSASAAPRCPRSARFCNRGRRDETMASSDMAKKALSRIRNSTIPHSKRMVTRVSWVVSGAPRLQDRLLQQADRFVAVPIDRRVDAHEGKAVRVDQQRD